MKLNNDFDAVDTINNVRSAEAENPADLFHETALKKPTVLVVDDDEASCQLLVKILRANKMDAEWTSNGLTAYDMALRQPYDLFILDVRMPFITGTEIAEGLKKKRPDARIILISSFADVALRQDAARLGVSLLSKPFTLNRLLQTTTEVLQQC